MLQGTELRRTIDKSLEFITCQYPWISVTSYFQMSSLFLAYPFQLPNFSCLEYLCPRAMIRLRLTIYNEVTYLLTYKTLAVLHRQTWAYHVGRIGSKKSHYSSKHHRRTTYCPSKATQPICADVWQPQPRLTFAAK